MSILASAQQKALRDIQLEEDINIMRTMKYVLSIDSIKQIYRLILKDGGTVLRCYHEGGNKYNLAISHEVEQYVDQLFTYKMPVISEKILEPIIKP